MVEEATYKGIDYGEEISNINLKTGIRFGVISQYEVLQVWADDSEANYPEEIECQHCGDTVKIEEVEHCQSCNKDITNDIDKLEVVSFTYNQDGYQAAQAHDDPDIFITMSPYFTYAQFCSPCAPGAVYLMSPFVNRWENMGTGQSGINKPEEYPEDYKVKAKQAGFEKGYCFGHDWFDEGVASYSVYNVETGELVKPEVD